MHVVGKVVYEYLSVISQLVDVSGVSSFEVIFEKQNKGRHLQIHSSCPILLPILAHFPIVSNLIVQETKLLVPFSSVALRRNTISTLECFS